MKASFRHCLLFAVLILAGGCSTFVRDWKLAAAQPRPAGALDGSWDGTWQSDDSGHHDRLRCLVTPKGGGRYDARFHANYKRVVNFEYTVPLQAVTTNGGFQFSGDANLGWLAGGLYHYEGRSDGTNFFSTYRCKYDHGTFQMSRPPLRPAP